MSIPEINDAWEAGLKVFALWPIVNGKCVCGDSKCEAVGKHPRIASWQNTPHWSEEQFETVELLSETGYGVLCADNLLVVDVDARNGGIESFDRLCNDIEVDLVASSDFVVETGSGGGSKHIYFKTTPGKSLLGKLDNYKGIDFKSNGFVCGAGSLHVSGNRYEVLKGFYQDIGSCPDGLLKLLERPEFHRAEISSGGFIDLSDNNIREMLGYIDGGIDGVTYAMWVEVGMAIHHATNGEGFDIWLEWSDSAYKGKHSGTADHKWHGFGKSQNPVTIGTLIARASAAGYQQSVTFQISDEEAAELAVANDISEHPIDISAVDLLRPPGFVGDVTKWINGQCRHPRERLAVAAALVTVGDIAGLRRKDDKDGITANLFAFCVAGSGTGKESVLQASAEIYRAAGIQTAVHGSIKSEQEIMRNLMRHQAAYYVIDEIGYLLRKITNAQKNGGAAYLDGVIGLLMSAYSKADGYMLLTGDAKEEVRKALLQELSQCRKLISENEDKDGRLERRLPQIERSLDMIDIGLEKPFVSILGFTTPETFDDIVNAEQATNGFMSRALLFREKETNPRRKKGFRKEPMSPRLLSALQNLYSPGEFSMAPLSRIEYHGTQLPVITDSKAFDMLEAIADWIEDYAEQHKSTTGLEAIVRRGYEICAKVSMILACAEGTRTVEHVKYAYALMRHDIDEKISLARSNMLEEAGLKDDAHRVLSLKIMNILDDDAWITFGTINNKLRKYRKEDINKALSIMVSELKIKQNVTKNEKSNRVVEKYKRA